MHTRELTLGADVDLATLAARTPNFSGAELAALANEAAIRSVRAEPHRHCLRRVLRLINAKNAYQYVRKKSVRAHV